MAQKFDTKATGNTKGRGWCLTVFEPEEIKAFADFETYVYKIIGIETCPKTKRMHGQCYIYFKNARSWKCLKEICKTAHIEKAKGTPQQNIKYCKKENNYTEYGDEPQQGKKKISANELREMSNEEIIDMDARCHKAYIGARNILCNKIKRGKWKKEIEVYWIQGPSECGKSDKIEELLEKLDIEEFEEVGYINGFYTGVSDGKGAAVYDDFRDNHMKASEFIRFIDYRRHKLNIKNGEVMNNYNYIFFSSIQKLSDIYSNVKEEQQHQWIRRCKCIDMYKKEDDDEPLSESDDE